MVLQGISNVSFGALGAYLNGYVSPYAIFGVKAITGTFMLLVSLSMDRRLEIEGDFEAEETVHADPGRSGIHLRRTFKEEAIHNYHIIKNALKVREL